MTSRNRIITAACYAAFIALGITATLLGPTFQSLTDRFHMPLQDGGIFTSFQWGGALVGVVIAGRLLDRVNARYMLSTGVLLMGSGLLILSAAQSQPVAFLSTLIVGLGMGFLDVSPNFVIVSLNPDRAGIALNWLNLVFGIGAIVGPQIVNLALRLNNFTLAYTATAVFALLLVIPFATISVPVRSIPHSEKPKARIQWLALLPFAIMQFLYVGTENGFSAWIPTQMQKVALSSESTATIAASIFWFGLTAGRLGATIALRRFTDEMLLIISIALVVVGVGVLLLLPTVEPVGLLTSFAVGFGCGPCFPALFTIIGRLYPTAAGTVSGVLMSLGSLGAVVLTWGQGQIGAGMNGGMIVVLVSAVIMLIASFPIRQHVLASASAS